MTSIVDTSVKNFNSTMANAPVLHGLSAAATLIAILDACLVTGFDQKTGVTLVVASGVATLTFTGTHSSQADSVILISGITGSLATLNGEQKVVSRPNATTLTFATSAPDGTATGTINMLMAPAGWEKVFSGTGKAVYRSLDPLSTKMLLRVDDTGSSIARMVGYETMSDVDTGANPFPTTAQISGGGYWAKSLVTTSGAVPWAIYADSRVFFFYNQPGIPSSTTYTGGPLRAFGDFIPLKPSGDPFCCILSVSALTGATQMRDSHILGGTGGGFYSPRAVSGVGSAQSHNTGPYVGTYTFTSGSDGNLGPYPSSIDGSLQLSKKFLAIAGQTPRADIPGAYHCPQSGLFGNFVFLDRVPGAGVLAGRTLQALVAQSAANDMGSAATASNSGVGFMDITGPWR